MRGAVPAVGQHEPRPAGVDATLARLVEAVAGLNSVSGSTQVAEALCSATAGVLDLEASWVVRRTATGVAVDAAWAQPGAAAPRIGLSRLAEVFHRWGRPAHPTSCTTGPVVIRWSPRRSGARAVRRTICWWGPPAFRGVFVDAELELARLLAAHAGARMAEVLGGGKPPASRAPPRSDELEFLRSLSGRLARAGSDVDVGHAVVTELRDVIDYRS